MTQRQRVNAADAEGVARQGERTYYVYDAAGQRVRKVTELANGNLKDERIYLGVFEVYRQHSGSHAGLERESLHIMDDKQRIALVETRNDVVDGTGKQLIRYQFGNHLGSDSLELDEQSQIISYEEYAPYGSSTYQAVRSQTETAKRYRYTGKERDEETGLDYHGARYCAPWLGRWTACDPAGEEEGSNLYQYCFGNPTGFVDPDGQSGKRLAIVMHNESKPAGKELPQPKKPVKPQQPTIKAPGKNASDQEKAKYKKDKNKAEKAFAESMKEYEKADKKYSSDLKKYKANKKLWSPYHQSQNEYKASEAALKAAGYDVVQVDSGKALLDALKKAGPIKELVVLSHATPFGLGGEGPGTGLFTDKPPGGATFDAKRAAKLSGLKKEIKDKKIVFEKDATIVLGMCRTAGGKEGTHVGSSTWTRPIEDTFAYQLAKLTGLEVFGSEGVSSYGGDTRKSTPWRYSAIGWHRFTQQSSTIKTENLKGQYLNVVTRKTSKKPE
nr:RHS repeat-associated core domain-containing protein [Leptodesmis sichuanensis]